MARGFAIFCLICAAWAFPAYGQLTLNVPDAGTALDLATAGIVDRDPRQRALAANLIAKFQFAALYPKLLTALNQFQPDPSGKFTATPGELAFEAVADAIIKAGIPVPSIDARKLYPQFPALAIILLSRSIDDNQSALSSILDDAKSGEVWLAAANLLALNPSQEFVSRLLNDFSVFVRILVFEPGTGGGMSYGDCLRVPASPLAVPGDWPPIFVYSLQLTRKSDAFTRTGAMSVTFTGRESTDPQPWKEEACGASIQELRRDLIVQLAGENSTAPDLRAVILNDVTRESDDQYREDVVQILLKQARSFAALAGQLRSKGLITQAQAAAQHLHMQVNIVHFSAQALPDLPNLQSLGIVGEYRNHFTWQPQQ